MNRKELLGQVNQYSAGRRNFIATTAAALTATSLGSSPFNLFFNQSGRIKAIVFDAFPIFDPRSVFSFVEAMFPEQGKELSNIWRSKQFEYCWLRAAGKQYKDFWRVTQDALVYAAKKSGIDLSVKGKNELMNQYLNLNIWEDVLPVLEELKKKEIRLSLLSNMTDKMLASCLTNSKIEKYFDQVISTDRIQSYKPDPNAYKSGVDILKLRKENILFVAFAGWDASGAKWFGYPTYWVNRLESPVEELNAIPDGIGTSMRDLLNFINQS
ncbi:MAG TPA: haloacid dehalogenase type II [Chitinophagaceae bacterium]|nr:haloacid dehalogenase type II [Chitinophagaceae bacterium]